MNLYDLFGRVFWRKPLLSEMNTAAKLMFVKLHLNKPQDFLNNVLWTDVTKVEVFAHSKPTTHSTVVKD